MRVIILSLLLHFATEIANHARLKYYYDQGDYKGMKAKLEDADWDKILGTSTINDQWLGFEYNKRYRMNSSLIDS